MSVSSSSPTLVDRKGPWFPIFLPLSGQCGIPVTVSALLVVDIDLTPQTCGRLLAALPFNNLYPSLSINSVCFSHSLFPSVVSFSVFHMSSLSSATHFRPLHLISWSLYTPQGFFSSSQFSFSSLCFSPSSSFHLFVTASPGTIHTKRFQKA